MRDNVDAVINDVISRPCAFDVFLNLLISQNSILLMRLTAFAGKQLLLLNITTIEQVSVSLIGLAFYPGSTPTFCLRSHVSALSLYHGRVFDHRKARFEVRDAT